MINKIIISIVCAFMLSGCSIFKRSENSAVPAKEAVKYQCKDCESNSAALRAEINSLKEQLALANSLVAEEKSRGENAVPDVAGNSIWKRVILHAISLVAGIAFGYFAFRCKKKV